MKWNFLIFLFLATAAACVAILERLRACAPYDGLTLTEFLEGIAGDLEAQQTDETAQSRALRAEIDKNAGSRYRITLMRLFKDSLNRRDKTKNLVKNIYLEKASRTFASHSYGYANTWGITPKNLAYYQSTGKRYTGVFGKDYNCTVECLAKSFECENCPICGRSYAAMAEGRKGVAGNPLWHKTFHIWFPDWIVVCRSCHPKIEGKPREEWKKVGTADLFGCL